MDVEAAKMIGAGIASLPLAGAGIGLGLISVSYTHLTLPTIYSV